MACYKFFYDVRNARCNKAVQPFIREVREVDKSKTAASDPLFGEFEKLANSFLTKEAQSYQDLDNQ